MFRLVQIDFSPTYAQLIFKMVFIVFKQFLANSYLGPEDPEEFSAGNLGVQMNNVLVWQWEAKYRFLNVKIQQ